MYQSLLVICREYRGQLIFSFATDITQTFVGLFAIAYFQR
jgi:hypothetical protein